MLITDYFKEATKFAEINSKRIINAINGIKINEGKELSKKKKIKKVKIEED
jgi:hypothetical protein